MSDLQDLEIEDQFYKERTEWTERIRELSIRMRNIREIGEVQVELYSDRQKLLEYAYKLGQILSKLNSKYRADRKAKMMYYSEEHNVRYGSNEKTTLIEGDLNEIKRKIDLIDNQMSFFNETVKTVDHFLYGVKSRIALEEFMRGGGIKQ
jgi:hypothetical protein